MEPIWRARELFHHCYNLTLSCWKLVCFDFSSSVTPNRLLSLEPLYFQSPRSRLCQKIWPNLHTHTETKLKFYILPNIR